MANRRVIRTPQSADLVTFKILSDGEELSAVYQVISVTVEKEVNRIPTAKIVLLDGDPASMEFKLSNMDIFIPGKEIEIKAGYHSDNETIFKGLVIKHGLKIRSDRSLLIVECRDKAVKTTIGRKSKYFYDINDSDIAEEIFSPYGLETEIEATDVQHAEMVQYNVSDWDFCVTRAQANGKICIADDGKLSIKKPDTSQEAIETVSFGATLMDFDAEIDARNQVSKISSYSWNAADQELTEVEANDADLHLNGNLTVDKLAEVAGPDNFELRTGDQTVDVELQAWADAKTMFNTLSKTRGRLKFQGIAAVKPDTMLNLDGVGDRFNGNIYISAVRHEITEGNWTVDAEFGINPKWFSETYDINDVPAAGLLAAVNGLQIGIVTQLQDDPDGEDRVLIRLPVIDKAEQGVWARIATLDAGENRGSYFRPEIDDEVIVGFLNSNPNDAIILGMLNSSDKPAPINASDDNHEKGFITRSEIKFIFNDEKKSVNVETPGGKKILLDDDLGEMILEDENSNKITLNSDGITMDSQADINLKTTGDVNIEGTNVTLKANAQFKAEGSAGAEVSTSATAVVKGSLVQIN